MNSSSEHPLLILLTQTPLPKEGPFNYVGFMVNLNAPCKNVLGIFTLKIRDGSKATPDEHVPSADLT